MTGVGTFIEMGRDQEIHPEIPGNDQNGTFIEKCQQILENPRKS
jgi:hypothetical protein